VRDERLPQRGVAQAVEHLERDVLHVVGDRAGRVAGVQQPVQLAGPLLDPGRGPVERRLEQHQSGDGQARGGCAQRDGRAGGVSAQHRPAPGGLDHRRHGRELVLQVDPAGAVAVCAPDPVVHDRRDPSLGQQLGGPGGLRVDRAERTGPGDEDHGRPLALPGRRVSVEGDGVAAGGRHGVRHGGPLGAGPDVV
jgi:hypothetical protein